MLTGKCFGRDFDTSENVKIFIIMSSLFLQDFKASDVFHCVEGLGPRSYKSLGFTL
jgi:hypothetical protein